MARLTLDEIKARAEYRALVATEPELGTAIDQVYQAAGDRIDDPAVRERAAAFLKQIGAESGAPRARISAGNPVEGFYGSVLRPRVLGEAEHGSLLEEILAAHPLLDDAAGLLEGKGRGHEAKLVGLLSAFLDPALGPAERTARIERGATDLEALATEAFGADLSGAGQLFSPLFERLAERWRSRVDHPPSPLEDAVRAWLPSPGERPTAKDALIVAGLKQLGRLFDRYLADPSNVVDLKDALVRVKEDLEVGGALDGDQIVRALQGLAKDLAESGSLGELRLGRAVRVAVGPSLSPLAAAQSVAQAVFPDGSELKEKLGADNAKVITDLIEVLTHLDRSPQEKKATLADLSGRLAPAVRSLLGALDQNKRPDFFETSLVGWSELAAGAAPKGVSSARFKDAARAIGKLLDRMITELKDPANERQLEAHLDVIRFFFRIEIDQLMKINPADPRGTREAIDAILTDLAKLFDIGWNFGRIAQAISDDDLSPEVQGDRVRTAIEDMGPFFVKMVQTGVEFADVGSDDKSHASVVASLQKLQDQARPLSIETVREIFRASVGKEIGDVYAEFDETPLASGSIGQAHRAKLKIGDELVDVVVKIQKPGVAESLHHNFNILRFALKILGAVATEAFEKSDLRKDLEERLGENAQLTANFEVRDLFNIIDGLAENLERSFARESDFAAEVRNLIRFGELFRFNPIIRIPAVYPEVSRGGVITMEYVPATPLRKLLARDPGRTEQDYLAIKTELIQTYVVQTLFFRFLHGDFHGGNTGVDENGKIVLYDLGQMVDLKGRLGAPIGFLLGLFTGNIDRVVKGLLGMSESPDGGRPQVDRTTFRADVERLVRSAQEQAATLLRNRVLLEWIDAFNRDLSWRIPDRLLREIPGFDADRRRDFVDTSTAIREAVTAALVGITNQEAPSLDSAALIDRAAAAAIGALAAHEKGKALPTEAIEPILRSELARALEWRKEEIEVALGREPAPEDGKQPGFFARIKRRFQRTTRAAERRAYTVALGAPQLLSMALSRHGLRLSAEYFQLIKTNLSFWMTVLRLKEVNTDVTIGKRVVWREAPFDVWALLRGLFLREPAEFVLRTLVKPIDAVKKLFPGAARPSFDRALPAPRARGPPVEDPS